MLNEKITNLLNDQVNKELYSAYLYLYFANYFEEKDLSGFANWYQIQACEERDHAMIMRKYLHSNGEKVVLKAIDEPKIKFNDNIDVLKAGLEHEQYVTSLINNIYLVASEIKDFRTMQFLNWFIKEQGEEEENASELASKIELFGSDLRSLYMIDQELSKRVYKAPSIE